MAYSKFDPNKIERIPALEAKLGVRLNCNAKVDDDGDIVIVWEMIAPKLECSMQVVASAYNRDGVIIGNAYDFVSGDDFDGIDSGEFSLSPPDDDEVSKLRIYPKRN